MTFGLLANTLYVIFVVAISLFLLCCFLFFIDYLMDKRASRWVKTTRFHPDSNGNRPFFYHFRTDRAYEPDSGNQEALPLNFVIGNSPVSPILQAKKEAPRPLFYSDGRSNRQSFSVQESDPELLSERTVERGWSERSGNVPAEPDFIGLLAARKGNGQPKAESIRAVTGITKGGSDAWANWSRIWDELK